MTTYEVKYKCYMHWTSPVVPLIRIKYRKLGRIFWTETDPEFVDYFAGSIWKSEYYSECEPNLSNYDRLRIFSRILDEKYNGDMERYVKAMTEFDISNRLIERNEEDEARDIAISLVTNGWKKTILKTGISSK